MKPLENHKKWFNPVVGAMELWIRDRPVGWERSWGRMGLYWGLVDGWVEYNPACRG